MSAQQTPLNHPTRPYFSIVIPSLNEEKYLPKLLKDLSSQTYKDFETIHVDAKSEDKTVKKAAAFTEKANLTTIFSQKRNVCHQRNLGTEKAQGEWVVFMDSDNRIPQHFLQGIKYQIEKRPKLDAFTCWMKVKSFPARYQPTIQVINLGLSLLNSEAFAAMLGIRRKVAQKHKFDEELAFMEDISLVKELNKAGYNFTCFRDPRYFTSPRRFEKEGLIKLTGVALEGRLRLMLSKNFSEYAKYPMLGGSYYEADSKNHLQNIISRLESFMRKASKKQLSRAKKIWSLVTDEEEY